MSYDPDKHHRKSTRLKQYDYSSAGAYFVTVVTQNRQHVFGEIKNGVMTPNAAGEMVERIWKALPERFLHVLLDTFVMMPNHVHGIIVINGETPSTSNESIIKTQSQNKTPSNVSVTDTQSQNPTSSNVIVGVGLVPTPAHANNQTPLDKTQQINNDATLISNDTVPTKNHSEWNEPSAYVSNRTAGAPTRGAPTIPQTPSIANENAQKSKRPPLGDVVGIFKSLTTHAYVMGVREKSWPPFDKRLWQRDYYEHIIRTNEALANIQAYIEANPQNWMKDSENTMKRNTGVKR